MNWLLRKALGVTFQQTAASMVAGGEGGGAGAGAGAGGAGAGGAGGGGEGAGASAANDLAWLPGDVAPEVRGYVQNKGWKTPVDLLTSYQGLEKLVGAKSLALPKDENDADGWGKVYDSLGRPKAATDYKLPVPEGAQVDQTLLKTAAETFHKAGLSTKQAQAVAGMWNDYMAAQTKAAEERYQTDSASAMQKLEQSWGGAFKERVETAKRAARTFGVTQDLADKMERGLGTEAFMDFMWRIGHALGEHGAPGMEGQQAGKGGALTPDQARAEIQRLKGDAEWNKAYIAGDAEKRKRMEQLHAWAYPQGA